MVIDNRSARLRAAALARGPCYNTRTSMGDITIQLFEKEAPKTVANFVGLATGRKEWTDPKTETTDDRTCRQRKPSPVRS